MSKLTSEDIVYGSLGCALWAAVIVLAGCGCVLAVWGTVKLVTS